MRASPRVTIRPRRGAARRGESFYTFAWRSTIHSYLHAWHMEKARLAKFGKSVWNPLASPCMRGNLQNLAPFAIAALVAGRWSDPQRACSVTGSACNRAWSCRH